jgi:hypothetical protein
VQSLSSRERGSSHNPKKSLAWRGLANQTFLVHQSSQMTDHLYQVWDHPHLPPMPRNRARTRSVPGQIVFKIPMGFLDHPQKWRVHTRTGLVREIRFFFPVGRPNIDSSLCRLCKVHIRGRIANNFRMPESPGGYAAVMAVKSKNTDTAGVR